MRFINYTLTISLIIFLLALSNMIHACTCGNSTTTINRTKVDSCCPSDGKIDNKSSCGVVDGCGFSPKQLNDHKHSSGSIVDSDCGPWSISYIAKELGVVKDMDKTMKSISYDTTKGATMMEMVNEAKKLGLSAKGYRMSYTELEKRELPVIIYLPNHFTVLVSIDKEKEILTFADSSQEKLTLTKEQFLKVWEGYVLEIRKQSLVKN